MTARDKFKKGDRVEISLDGQYHFRNYIPGYKGTVPRYGTVATRPGMRQTVCVLVDGRKTPDMYHIDFWKRI